MRLLVDGVFFQLAASGIARVWAALLPRLVESGKVDVFLLDRGGAPIIPGVTTIPFPAYRDRYTADDSLLLQKICDHLSIDIFTSTYYTTPLSTPMLLIVYDMIPERFDFDLSHRFWMEKEITISFARRFIAISDMTRRDLLEFYPEIGTDSVVVAHPGIDPGTFCPQPEAAIRAYQKAAGLKRPYMLLVGSREQNKGYKNGKLFFEACRALGDVDFDILCVGGEPEIDPAWLAMLPSAVTVVKTRASDADLALAYAGAIALVYPSLYEGFGLPVVEAMACGCPVITTRAGSLAEIVTGNCCLTVDGISVSQMKEALIAVRRPGERVRLVKAGLARAADFRWRDMVAAMVQQLGVLQVEHQSGTFDAFFGRWRTLRHIQGGVDVEPII